MIQVFGYKKCNTCRKAAHHLDKLRLEFSFVDITENPPSAAVMKRMLSQAGVEFPKLFNTSGVLYREMKLKNQLAAMTESQALQLLAEHGRLIKRPLVTDQKKTTIGYNEMVFEQTWR